MKMKKPKKFKTPKKFRTEYGFEAWMLNGEYHREDGPAVIYDSGFSSWYLHGKRHRIGGPAIEDVNASYYEWWIDDCRYLSIEKYMEKLLELDHGEAAIEMMFKYEWFSSG